MARNKSDEQQLEAAVRLTPCPLPQASRLIVTFDEHVISNNFKFGVIYQKLGQVCSRPPPCTPTHLTGYLGPPQGTVSQELRGCQGVLLPAFLG